MSAEKLKETFADPAFQKREQTLSLATMYFLTMHERCHVALDHKSRLSEIRKLAEPEKSLQIQQLEVDADRCAIEIVNKDEARAKGSPISFFGVLIIVASQAIVSARPALSSERSHPSTRSRLSFAKDRVLQFIGPPKTDAAERYAATVSGTAEYFDALLTKLEVPR